jgi:hypothetical protein
VQPQADPRACVPSGSTCIAINPDVTAETIASTVCTAGYTAGVRPASGYIAGMKIKLGRETGLSPEVAQTLVLDHIIPLALGGHPREPSNLQLQDAAESYRKDRLEKKLQCLTRLRLRPTRCIATPTAVDSGRCEWTPAAPAGTCPGYRSLTLGGSEDPWTTGARDDDSTIRGGRVA